ncbi:MAG: OmpA family protein [Gemmatimonadaceae bacterium]
MTDVDDLTGSDGSGPWPAFADLLAATSLLFLILFAAVAVPAIRRVAVAEGQRSKIKRLQDALTREASGHRIEVQPVGDYLRIIIKGNATFPQDQYALATLRPEGKQILRSVGQLIRRDSLLDDIDQVQVVGHTSTEGSDERNWVLSASRAATVSLFLIDSVQIPACQVTAMGRSRYYPVDATRAKASGAIDANDRRIELEVRPVIPGDLNQQLRRKDCIDARRRP